MIAEMMYFAFDILTGFVALTRQNQHIAGQQIIHCHFYGFGTVGNIIGAGTSRHDFVADIFGFFKTGIIIGYINDIGQIMRYSAHQRTFTLVAIAAAAENDLQPTGRMRTQSFQDIFQTVGRMGIINIHGGAVGGMSDQLQPAFGTFDIADKGHSSPEIRRPAEYLLSSDGRNTQYPVFARAAAALIAAV